MAGIENAVILAAGLGSRLRPLTDEEPKFLTEVNGKSIGEQTLAILEKNGIRNVCIIIGYLGDIIKKRLGESFGNCKISYVVNPIYRETNSMYSAWLARDILEKGALLIEGDTIFDEQLITKALVDDGKAYWVLDRFRPEYDGSMCIGQPGEAIESNQIIRGKIPEYKENYFKSTGVLKITPDYGKAFSQWLDKYVKEGDVKIYYDVVISRHIKDLPLYVLDVTGVKWFEIDTPEDLKRAEQTLEPQRYVIVVIDGAADDPLPELNHKTPLERAEVPTLHYIAKNGRTGLLKTMYDGLPLASIVANLGILGYNPWRYYPNGTASFEALAKEVYLGPGDIALRCKIVTVEDGILAEFKGGSDATSLAHEAIGHFLSKNGAFEFVKGQSNRNSIIFRDVNINVADLDTKPPHENAGKPITNLFPKGCNEISSHVAMVLKDLMIKSSEYFKKESIFQNTGAPMLYPWSPSSEPKLPSFYRKFGMDGAVVCGLDSIRGIGIAARMEHKSINGATGDSNTDLSAKIQVAKNALRYNEFVYIHLSGPDKESHNGNSDAKSLFLEKIDQELISIILEHLEDNYANNFRLAVLPSHYTYTASGLHGARPVPYAICGNGIAPDGANRYSEKVIEKATNTLLKSYEFMPYFIGFNKTYNHIMDS